MADYLECVDGDWSLPVLNRPVWWQKWMVMCTTEGERHVRVERRLESAPLIPRLADHTLFVLERR